MEKRDLYDENKNLTGEWIFKGDSIPFGKYYLTVIVWMQNSKGEFLIQQRVPEKDNKWATTGGHPVSGESSLDGIVTEIREELGLIVEPNSLVLFKTERTEDDFVDHYYMRCDFNINDVTIQKEEVQDVKWASIEKINKIIENKEFSNSHAQFFKYLIKN